MSVQCAWSKFAMACRVNSIYYLCRGFLTSAFLGRHWGSNIKEGILYYPNTCTDGHYHLIKWRFLSHGELTARAASCWAIGVSDMEVSSWVVKHTISIERLCEMFNMPLNSVIDGFTTLKAEGLMDPLNVFT